MKLCHGESYLKYRRRAKRKDRDEYLYVCKAKLPDGSECNNKIQWTKQGGYYQVKAKSSLETKSVTLQLRMTPTNRKLISVLTPAEQTAALLEAARRKADTSDVSVLAR